MKRKVKYVKCAQFVLSDALSSFRKAQAGSLWLQFIVCRHIEGDLTVV